MNKKGFLKHADFFLLDVVCLILAYFLAGGFRNISEQLNDDIYRLLMVLEILTLVTVVYFYAPYKSILRKKFTSLMLTTITFGILQFVIVAFLLFTTKNGEKISRLFLGFQYVFFAGLSFVLKISWRKFIRHKAKASIDDGSKSLLVVTTRSNVDGLKHNLGRYNYEFFRVIGICLLDDDSCKRQNGFDVVCTKNNLLRYCCNNWVDSVFFDMDYQLIPEEILNGLALAGITTHLRLMKVEAFEGQDQTVEKLLNYPVLTSMVKERTGFDNFAKRTMDIVGGIIGCLFMVIIMIIIGPIIYINSPGPIFYKQERIGQNGRRFYMYKFRSMVINAEAMKAELMDRNRVKDGMMLSLIHI